MCTRQLTTYFKTLRSTRVRSYTPLITALGRLNKAELWVQFQPALQGKFQVSQGTKWDPKSPTISSATTCHHLPLLSGDQTVGLCLLKQVSGFYLHVCLCTCMYLVPADTRRSVRSPGTGAKGSCELLCVCWEINPGPLEARANLWTISTIHHCV